MDLTRYDDTFQKLHHQHQTCLQAADPRTLQVLKKMLRYASAHNDIELEGYVHHSIAYVEHFILGRYEKFLEHLRLATQCLMRSEDKSEMMHVYYLVAIDAMNKGVYDIAFHFFIRAHNLAEDAGKTTSAAILDESLAHVLMQIGELKRARIFIRRAMRGILKDTEHPHYHSNMLSGYINDAIISLDQGKVTAARGVYNRVKPLIESDPDAYTHGSHLDYMLMSMRLFLAEGNTDAAERLLRPLMKQIGENPQIHLYIEEIRKLCEKLLEQGAIKQAGKVIGAVADSSIAEDALGALRTFADLKVDYAIATGSDRKIDESFREQDRIYACLMLAQRNSYRFAQELVNLTNEIRKEREAVYAENLELTRLSREDALCGIANRYAGNLFLEEAFDRAMRKKRGLGIACFDIDGLKMYNDTFGHLKGDECLRSFGDVLKKHASAYGYFPTRFGGDEFILIFEDTSTRDINHAVNEIKKDAPISVSSGVFNAVPTDRQRSWDFLLEADRALYSEKGKKQVRRTSE